MKPVLRLANDDIW